MGEGGSLDEKKSEHQEFGILHSGSNRRVLSLCRSWKHTAHVNMTVHGIDQMMSAKRSEESMFGTEVVIDSSHVNIGSERQSDGGKISLRIELIAAVQGIVRQRDCAPELLDGAVNSQAPWIALKRCGSQTRRQRHRPKRRKRSVGVANS